MVRMVNERDDNDNRSPGRGDKLRYQGSNPTGSQKHSFTPEYSDDMDYTEGGAHLNQRTRMKSSNYSENRPSSECCRENGLNLKEPLT